MIVPTAKLMQDIAAVQRGAIYVPHMVPAVIGGQPYTVNADGVLKHPQNVSISDFVLSFLALGLRFVGAPTAVAIPASFGHLPSTWAARAVDLVHAWHSSRHAELEAYLRRDDVRVPLERFELAEEIQRYGSAHKALLAIAAISALRAYRSDTAMVRECLLGSEPTATDDELAEALAIAFDALARQAIEDTVSRRTEARR